MRFLNRVLDSLAVTMTEGVDCQIEDVALQNIGFLIDFLHISRKNMKEPSSEIFLRNLKHRKATAPPEYNPFILIISTQLP